MLLDRSECVKILENVKSGERVKLLDYSVVKNHTAVGYLGDYYALTISYCNEGVKREVQLFIKAIPVNSLELQKEAIFQKEAWIYDTLLAEMRKCCKYIIKYYTLNKTKKPLTAKVKWSADCYYTRSDLLVLEDIKLQGFQAADSTELSEVHMNQLIKSMAAFHAASLVYEHQTNCDIGQVYGDHLLEITVDSEIAWFTTGLAAVLATIRSLPQYQGVREQSYIDNKLLSIMEEIYDQAASSKKYRNVLCHRDLWAGNIFFPAEKTGPALLIDFQTCRYTPPASDISFSLYMNLSSKDRKQMETKFIDLYYSCLVENLSDAGLKDLLISKSELIESYEEFRLFGVVYRAVSATIIKVPTEFITNDFKYVDRSEIILSYMQSNLEFRTYMEECCVDVMEMALARENM
ncbi:hypothetical protein KR009_004846 [Drosophila setifemur]|nr:hypothetical protein KR009_004846 [Drosophila setifemur]